MPTDADQIKDLLDGIDAAWLNRRPRDLEPLLHENIVFAPPGFQGRAGGRETLVAGFADFCENAALDSYKRTDLQIDVVGDVGVGTFKFEMVYGREGQKYKCAGRDFWVVARNEGRWKAVWRTMLEVTEEPVSG
jgi:hypothetical protein